MRRMIGLGHARGFCRGVGPGLALRHAARDQQPAIVGSGETVHCRRAVDPANHLVPPGVDDRNRVYVTERYVHPAFRGSRSRNRHNGKQAQERCLAGLKAMFHFMLPFRNLSLWRDAVYVFRTPRQSDSSRRRSLELAVCDLATCVA